mmetsp:Transcript_55731/g.154262  ORF Transcript_55731/g.154262 Transcript_55731/m.154262 type:complete len:107 (+) Transcript_55731:327-647(+)
MAVLVLDVVVAWALLAKALLDLDEVLVPVSPRMALADSVAWMEGKLLVEPQFFVRSARALPASPAPPTKHDADNSAAAYRGTCVVQQDRGAAGARVEPKAALAMCS